MSAASSFRLGRNKELNSWVEMETQVDRSDIYLFFPFLLRLQTPDVHVFTASGPLQGTDIAVPGLRPFYADVYP